MNGVYSSVTLTNPFNANCSGCSECAEIAETELGLNWLLFEPTHPAFWELYKNNYSCATCTY